MSPTSYQTAPPRGVGITLPRSTSCPNRADTLPSMRFWRRRGIEHEPGTDLLPAPRMERALVALAFHTQQLDDRLDRLERRLDASIDVALDSPTHDDVLEVRLHSARVAAELSRMAVELRAEIEHAMATVAAPVPSARDRRVHLVADSIVDLADRIDTMPSDLAHNA